MTRTVESREDGKVVTDPPVVLTRTPGVATEPAPRRGARRRAAKEARAARKAARRAELNPTDSRATTIEVRIDPGDPLLTFLQDAPGPLEIKTLPPTSPAVARLREQGAQVVVPLITSGELVGVLALGPRLSERTYTRNDRRLLDSLTRYAAPALRLGQVMRQQENEVRDRERIEQELHVAQLVQQQFLPAELPELGGWHVAAFYRPARTVGGDFYDVIQLADGRVMVVTGDVTDKGIPAALVMASTTALLRSAAEVTSSPSEVLRRVNELLIPQIPMNMFVTCQVLVIELDTGRTLFANAGHNLPYISRAGQVVQLAARGMPLGLMPGSRYDDVETVIEPDDIVLLYSDGITEQHDRAGEMFGFGRTGEVVAGARSGDELVDRAIESLSAFSVGVEQEDDITLVTLHRGRSSGYHDTVSFAVPSIAGGERDVMDRVAAIVEGALPARRLEDLKTAVSETAMNAIEHGNRGDQNLDVEVVVRRTAESITVDVADFGRGRRSEADIPDIDLKLAGLQAPRGWGLFLVRELTDRVEEITDGDRHIVRLVMHTTEHEGNES
ncbi:SpoIIE family protein phosphatase [Amnibacterium sp.]|uniref:ATP-binding SpoIIE family protein phosphatase n=1 Tax=Amnibacterium sp. TaxID=1872496 RepID=UPI0026227DA9|nr:SpoIIE family protein phosphatase [Amnibacterium sp.]MCU1472889.1 Protein serine phosphatase with sensor(S) [Amnibacterium sp.]